MSNGYCHIDDKENLHMGSKSQNYQAVTPKPGIPNMYIAIPESTSSKKEINQQEETPPINSTSVKVQAGQLVYLMSDGESDSDKKYEPLKERTSVNVGTVGEAKNNQRAKIATPHTQHTGQFITYQNNQASVDDNVMEDIESINQKKPEIQNKSAEKQRPRYSATDHLSSQIHDSTDANELMGQILNGKVKLSVKKLIGVSPKLHQAFFRSGWNNSTSKSHARVGVSEPVQPELKINSSQLTSKPMVPKSKTAYGMHSLYVPVTINQQELMVLINTGSEINLLSQKYAEMLKLPMENKLQVTMIVQTGEVTSFYTFCDEVPVQIGDIVTHTPFLIFKRGDQQLILERPWQFAACWGCNTSEDNRVSVDTRPEEDEEDVMKTMGIRINDEKVEGQEIEKNREVRSVGSIAGIGAYSNEEKHNSGVGESKSTLSLIGLTSTLVNQMDQSEDKDNFASGVQIFQPPLPNPDSITAHCKHYTCDINSSLIHKPIPQSAQSIYTSLNKNHNFVTKKSCQIDIFNSGWDIRPSSSEVWRVCTAYKQKADKIRPLAPGKSDGSKPEGLDNWVDVCLNKYYPEKKHITFNCEFDDHIRPRITPFPVGEQLTNKRIEKLKIGFKLTSQKKEFFISVLYKHEGALAWSFKDLYGIHPECLPPQVIQTEPHEAWQTKTYQISHALHDKLIKIIQDRLEAKTLEPCHGSYTNSYFLVAKKQKGKYHLVDTVHMYNKVTIQDTFISPNVDKYTEDFSRLVMASLCNLFSGYNNFPLAEESRDMTAIAISIGLFHHTTLVQGAMNLPAQAQHRIMKIIHKVFPEIAQAFMDNLGGKRITYQR
ncbi:conserved hypothetical protein [Coccidioides posadasii str. Silveira]|uniref:DUF4100 domain-containing protein n=1 Tax=Coccidioides posadasii (strain RMSCC 757 / Silveira) TaxID=443226 RepID=E9DJM9_COCPS|nr:conserved hypothetical protein [Coccidioides posadasii str. Silveira]